MPIVLYNVPARTVTDIAVETVGVLSHLKNIVGIKDATDDMNRIMPHAALASGADFCQISGNDPTALAHRAMGGTGCISVTANVAPESCAEMHKAVDDGDWDGARIIAQRLAPLHAALFASASPGPTKYALAKLGLCQPDTRLPIVGPDEAARAEIDAAMALAGIK